MLTIPHQLSLHEKVWQKYNQLKEYTGQERWIDICEGVRYTRHLWTLGLGSREFFISGPFIILEQTSSLWCGNQWCCPLCSAQLPDCPLWSRQHHSGTATNDAAQSAVPSCQTVHSRADNITLTQQPMMLPSLQCPVARLSTLQQTTSLRHSNQWCCPVCSAQLPDCPLYSRQHHSDTATNDVAQSAVPSSAIKVISVILYMKFLLFIVSFFSICKA